MRFATAVVTLVIAAVGAAAYPALRASALATVPGAELRRRLASASPLDAFLADHGQAIGGVLLIAAGLLIAVLVYLSVDAYVWVEERSRRSALSRAEWRRVRREREDWGL